MMVRRLQCFPFGVAYFQGKTVKFPGSNPENGWLDDDRLSAYFQGTNLSFREAVDLAYCLLHQPSIQGTWFKGKHGHKKLSKLNNDQVTTNLKLNWIKWSLKNKWLHLFAGCFFWWRVGYLWISGSSTNNFLLKKTYFQIGATLQIMKHLENIAWLSNAKTWRKTSGLGGNGLNWTHGTISASLKRAKQKICFWWSIPYHPCMAYLPIYIWLIFMVNYGKCIGKYTIHGRHGNHQVNQLLSRTYSIQNHILQTAWNFGTRIIGSQNCSLEY